LLGAALACLTLWSSSTAVSHADVRVDNVQVPFYARVIEGEKWTAASFYRPPGCVPREFNLISFFDVPRVFQCGPMTMQGYAIFENGPGIDPAPMLGRADGTGAVPIWFVRTHKYQKVSADGVVTIGELERLHPLRGSARFYTEVLENDHARESYHFHALATGKLGHRSFAFLTYRDYDKGLLLNELIEY
jgi:hypothetical protein